MQLKESQKYICDFCSKNQKDVGVMVTASASNPAAICDACILDCCKILTDKLKEKIINQMEV